MPFQRALASTVHLQLQEITHTLPDLACRLVIALPADRKMLSFQTKELLYVQTQLEQRLRTAVRLQRRQRQIDRSTQAQREWGDRLVLLIEDMACYADMLTHLVDEYDIDPEGTTQCLREVEKDSTAFLREILAMQRAMGAIVQPSARPHFLQAVGDMLHTAVHTPMAQTSDLSTKV